MDLSDFPGLNKLPQKKTTRVSQTFYTADADVIFESHDSVLFHVHKKFLDANTGGFPPQEIQTFEEIVPLEEDSTTLELLFQFIYPRRHPGLETIEFPLLGALAEAAEKYEVYSAMSICCIRMCDFVSQKPTEVFCFAKKHNYPHLISQAAPLMIGLPLHEVIPTLPQNLIVPWLRYHHEYSSKLLACAVSFSATHKTSNPNRYSWADPCTDWTVFWQQIIAQLGNKIAAVRDLDTLFAPPLQLKENCCKLALETWRNQMESELRKVPEFTNFL